MRGKDRAAHGGRRHIFEGSSSSLLTLCSAIGQGLDERTDQILLEIRQLRFDLPTGKNFILHRFLEETEVYAETVRESSTVSGATNAENFERASIKSASEGEESTVRRTREAPNASLAKFSEPSEESPSIDKPNNQGQTRLHLALKGSNEGIIAKLLKDGASLTAKDNRGMTALDFASTTGYHLIIKMILDAEFAGPLINGATEMHRAAYVGDLVTLR